MNSMLLQLLGPGLCQAALPLWLHNLWHRISRRLLLHTRTPG